MQALRYLDFDLKIERSTGGYTARVLDSPAGEASTEFTVPFTDDRLELLLLKLGGTGRAVTKRGISTAEQDAARELGGKLFESVLGHDVRACLRSSLSQAETQENTGLRIKLRLQEVPELADLPWEFLFDASMNRFLAQSNQTPVVRYLEMPGRIRPLTVGLPLEVLVMVSSPDDPAFPRLDVERERAHIVDALRPLTEQGKVRIIWLEEATLTMLRHTLRAGAYHVFHFVGHGGFEPKAEEGVLVLEDEQRRRGVLVDAHRIGTLLRDHPSLRLALLNSCEGARNSRTDPFAGVAAGLIQQGVPAVVAMQFEITDEAAILFSKEFYTALAEGLPVDASVAEARKAVYAQPNDLEWATPVLYTRAPDGVLFDLTQNVAASRPAAVTAPPPKPEPSTLQPPPSLQTERTPAALATPPPGPDATPQRPPYAEPDRMPAAVTAPPPRPQPQKPPDSPSAEPHHGLGPQTAVPRSAGLPQPGVPAAPAAPAGDKDPTVAAAISFFLPGMGQVYLGQSSKGFILLGVWAVALFSACGTMYVDEETAMSLFLTTTGAWVLSFVDAYKMANKMRRGEPIRPGQFFWQK